MKLVKLLLLIFAFIEGAIALGDMTLKGPLTDRKRAKMYFKEEKFQESQKLWADIVRDKPYDSLAHYNLGLASYMAADFQVAVENFKKVAESKSELSLTAYYWLAKSFEKQNKKQAAAMSLAIALQRPQVPLALYQRFLDLVELW